MKILVGSRKNTVELNVTQVNEPDDPRLEMFKNKCHIVATLHTEGEISPKHARGLMVVLSNWYLAKKPAWHWTNKVVISEITQVLGRNSTYELLKKHGYKYENEAWKIR